MKLSILGMTIAAAVGIMAGSAAAQSPAQPPFAAVVQAYAEAFNRRDAAAVTALYTDDAILIVPTGILRGREAILKNREAAVKAGGHDLNVRVAAYEVQGTSAWSVAEYNLLVPGKDGSDTPSKGFASVFWVRSGDAWKLHVHTLSPAPPPQQ